MFTVLAAAVRMYSARMRLTISLPFLFFATGIRTCSPVATSPSQPLSERTNPCRSTNPSPAVVSPAPPTFSSRLLTFPRFGTSWSRVPFAFDMSTGLLSQKSTLYSTMPCALRSASLMSVMTSFSGSFGSTSPKTMPRSVSYWPTLPNEAPPYATARELIWILVTRPSAAPAKASGSSPTNATLTERGIVFPSRKAIDEARRPLSTYDRRRTDQWLPGARVSRVLASRSEPREPETSGLFRCSYGVLSDRLLLLAPGSGGQDQIRDLLWVGDQGKVTCL